MTESMQEERSTVQEGVERVQETAGQAVQQVREQAEEVRGRAGERVRSELDTRSTDAGGQLRTTAGAMRRTGEQLREEGSDTPARVVDAVAERAERLGSYLEQADADRMLRDVEAFARRQPWLAAAGGFVLGLLGSRFLKASSEGRYASSNGSAAQGAYAVGPVGGGPSGAVE
jgi:ElaB/YqjD/DUF883 family membrane-anchored ribosome-binding protein